MSQVYFTDEERDRLMSEADRLMRSMSMSEAARRLGIVPSTLFYWRGGRRRNVRDATKWTWRHECILWGIDPTYYTRHSA